MDYSFQTYDESHNGTVGELIEIAEQWKNNSFDLQVDRDNFHMNYDGSIDALDRGKRVVLHPSKTAITQLLMKIPEQPSIPPRFVSQIPTDLAAHNVNRLMRESTGNFVLRCRKRDDGINVLRGIVTDRYSPMTHWDVLQEAGALISEMNLSEAKESFLSDDFMRVCTESDDVNHQIAFRVGDVTKFGVNITHGETGLRKCEVKLFAFRLVCSNGLVIPQEFGGVAKRHLGDMAGFLQKGIQGIRDGFSVVKRSFAHVMSLSVDNIPQTRRMKISVLLEEDEEGAIYERVANIYDYVQEVTEAGKKFPEMVRNSIEEAAGELLLLA